MVTPVVTVIVPTLAADDALADCLRSLENQTFKQFEVIVVDNSGAHRAQAPGPRARVIANTRNVGFGAAVNQGILASTAPFVATLNDDAVADPKWLDRLVRLLEAKPAAGMCASEVRLAGCAKLDSAGMLISEDGSSKQRGHGDDPANFANECDALLPSGSAALYRRKMLDEIGLFDESYFLYCEDTDLGLRGRRAGWECVYAAGAVVEHRYSHSAGRATPLKAYFVERNRLYTAVKNFPMRMLALAPFFTLARYFWHLISVFEGRGKAAEFRAAGFSASLLPFLVLRAHVAAAFRLPRLVAARRKIRGTSKLNDREFCALLRKNLIPVRQVAAL
jgi:GT2 family glycosyltransferase